jgi:hypothetical protein
MDFLCVCIMQKVKYPYPSGPLPRKHKLEKNLDLFFFMSLGWSNWGVVSLYLIKDPAVALTMATAHNCEVSVSRVPILLISFNTKKMNQLNA